MLRNAVVSGPTSQASTWASTEEEGAHGIDHDTVAALRAEGDDLERLVADLPSERWQTSTPAKGWT